MGKATKEHRKKVQARNKRLELAKQTFNKKFKEEFLKELEAEKLRRMAEDPEFALKVQNMEALSKAELQKELDENIEGE
jgi:hypothetical protein